MTYRRGKEINEVLDNDNIILLNSNVPTHINIANGFMSDIDLTFSNVSLA